MPPKNNFAACAPIVLALPLGLALLGLTGCTISAQRNGDSKRVDLSTPFGGLKVRTQIDPKEIGLSVYPKARVKPSEEADHDKSANVNISTPFFGLKVIAIEYESDDPPEKILDFYRKDLARYGRVVECKGSSGHVRHDREERLTLTLNCDDAGSGKGVELKAGEGSSQHIVGVTPQGNGTDFGLVYIQIRGKNETM